jgi:hypothetical protein
MEQNFNQSFSAIHFKLENQQEEFNGYMNKFEEFNNAEKNHHKIMMKQFSKNKRRIQNESKQLQSMETKLN